jgi:type IV pilus assembly protein PilB
MIKNAPVAKIVHEIIKHAVEAGASDIHIEPLENESRVRYRIDGILHNSLSLPKNIHDSIVARIKVLSRLKLDETRVPQGGRIRLTIEDKDIDFRVSCLPLMGQEKVVMRVLDTTKGVLSLEQLGFYGSNMDLVKRNIDKTVGIILVTGPTGSGKSTTLYSIMHMLNNEGVNIVTLEDPVEYFIHGINQSQIRPDIGFTFAAGLRSLLLMTAHAAPPTSVTLN